MASRFSSSSVSLEIKLTKVGEKLLHLPSSTEEIIECLVRTEDILSRLPQSASISMTKPLNPVIEALIAEDLVRHSNMVVKISVAYCICEIMRIMALDTPYDDNQMKEFFELVVTAFEKVSSSSGGCYTKMIKVLKAFSSGKFVVMMCDLQLEGLVVRLFKRFLTVADSSSSAVVSKMEKIMTVIIKESKELPRELVNLLAINGKSNKEIASPVCTQLAKKLLKIYADQLNPDIPDMTVRRWLHSESEKKSLAIVETPMQSNPVTSVNGKRKKQIHSAEHGENLVGSRIKVWWPEDNTYYEGTVKSYQSRKKKHKVWYDDGDKELIDLKTQKWELVEEAQSADHGENLVGSRIKVWWPADEEYYLGVVASFDSKCKMHKVLYSDGFEEIIDLKLKQWMFENLAAIPDSSLVQAVPRDVSSNQSGIICAHGYKVKNVNAPILEAILKKHGDIAATCVFPDAALRTSLLDAVCEIVGRIETNDVTNIISQMEEIKSQLSAAEAAKINVSWLRASLNALHKRNEAGKKVTLNREVQKNTILVKKAARSDLNKFVAAQNQFAEAKRCVEILDLVEKKVNNNVLESEAEKDLWARHPII
ncbi:phospholipase-like protein [Artemisia annua]|uniref:Phospholipase-like protein n=1 Tax=Artemisia annua TaxID=35608 RepID=A0A2U1PFE6_ARTAN|nr:phospholipase-like protein [Artemisia annua]